MRWPALLLRLLLCALLGCAAACSRKEAPQATAQGAAQLFFDQIHEGKFAPAFESTTFTFQEQQTLKFFIERLRDYELTDSKVALSPLPGEPAEAKMAKFNVEVTRNNGQKYTLVLTMQREKAAWRVFSLRTPRDPRTGVSDNLFTMIGRPVALSYGATKKVPDDATVRRLVHQSMVLFSDAIQTQSFWEFYEHASAAWQKELTEQKLANAFHSFIEREVNMSGIVDLQPVFDVPPEINSEGYLVVTGHYPTKPYEVHFTLRYIYELPEWKLLGLNCHLKKVGE
jgi:hypothetical protein